MTWSKMITIAMQGGKKICLNATNETINSYNVCEMIVKNRYSVSSLE